MILGFKTHINGKPTFFPEKIKACTVLSYRAQYEPKLHTIRKGKRWKKGMKMHMATGVRTNNYHQFNGGAVGLEYCLSVQFIQIDNNEINGRRVFVEDDGDDTFPKTLSEAEIRTLALNDGFASVDDFWSFFQGRFTGQIIHWTTMRY